MSSENDRLARETESATTELPAVAEKLAAVFPAVKEALPLANDGHRAGSTSITEYVAGLLTRCDESVKRLN